MQALPIAMVPGQQDRLAVKVGREGVGEWRAANVEWESSSPNVVQVTVEAGVAFLRAIQPGFAQVTARVPNTSMRSAGGGLYHEDTRIEIYSVNVNVRDPQHSQHFEWGGIEHLRGR